MGWWRNDQGDFVGDGPADLVADGLTGLNADVGRRIRLGELLAALDVVLRTKHADLLAPAERVLGSVAAELDVDEELERIYAESTVEPTVRDRIDALCARISQEYEMAFERRPTLSEMLASFGFVLGYRAERRLDLPELSSVRRIYVAATNPQ